MHSVAILLVLLAAHLMPGREAQAQGEFIRKSLRKRAEATPALAPAFFGQTGMYTIYSADRFPKGGAGVSLYTTWFSQKSFLAPNTDHRKQEAFLSLTGAPWDTSAQLGIESGFEFSLMAKISSDLLTNTDTDEARQLQAAGDLGFGLKYTLSPGGRVHTGLNTFVYLVTDEESGLYDFGATGYETRALLTADFSEGKEEGIGFRSHLNLGLLFDNTDTLIEHRRFPVSLTERFALGVSGENAAVMGLGFETIFLPVAFLLETTLQYDLDSEIKDDDNQPLKLGLTDNPIYLTPGIRLLPFQNLVLDGGVRLGFLTSEIDISKDRKEKLVPDWTLVVGLSWSDLPERARVRRVIVRLGQIRGSVVDAGTGQPVGGAVISFVSPIGLPAVASDPESGVYTAQNLRPGAYKMKVEKAGYRTAEVEATIQRNESVDLEIRLNPMDSAPEGLLEGTVEDPNGNPVAAVVTIDGGRIRTGTDPRSGRFSATVEPGPHDLRVEGQGFRPNDSQVSVEAGRPRSVRVVLKPQDKVRVTGEKIVIYEKVLFATGSPNILPVSYAILDAVVDVLRQEARLRVRVEGHTDNEGGRQRNLALSQERAESVARYIAGKGIDATRLEAKGYADLVPVADNESPEGRSRNRRVEFTILGAAAPSIQAPTPAPSRPAAPPKDRFVEIATTTPAEVYSVPGGRLTGGALVVSLPPKTRIQVLDQKGVWLQIKLPNGQSGWIHQNVTRPSE